MNKYESFSSILNLIPNNDPYEEAVELVMEVTRNVASQLEDLQRPLNVFVVDQHEVEHFQPMSPGYYHGGLDGDMRRIGADFKSAAAKLYETEGFAQLELSESTRDKLLLNDEYYRYAE